MTEESSKWWDDFTIENYDWRDADPLANTFVDLFLLALIRAHPMQTGNKQTDLERLRDAKKAVFGIKPRDDLKQSRDFPLLVEMAKEYIADRGGAQYLREEGRIVWGDHDEKACRGRKTIARDVLHRLKHQGIEFCSMVEENSVVARLARKFGENKNELVEQVACYGNIETEFMSGWIVQAKELFGPFFIPVSGPDDPVRDLKRLF